MSLTLSPLLRSWFYIFPNGYLFASPGFASDTTKFGITIVVSIDGRPFEIETSAGIATGSAIVVQTGVRRLLRAIDVPVVSVGITAPHPDFRVFSTRDCHEPVKVLPRDVFKPYDAQMLAALDGGASAVAAQRLAEGMSRAVVARLPKPRPLDARIERALQLLEERPGLGMEALADKVGLSYHRLSHLFSESMGLPLRSYVLARKLDAAATLAGSGMSLTEIAFAAGFADSAHFSKTWMRASGASPSQFFTNRSVALRSVFLGGKPVLCS